MDADELKGLGRDGIISKAVEMIKENAGVDGSTFKLENFDIVKVMASSSTVQVTFGMRVRYVPRKSSACYGIYVNLTDNMMSYGNTSNPSKFKARARTMFFEPTDGHRKAMAFVSEAIQRQYPGDIEPCTVFEERKHYRVLIVNPDVEGGYDVDKKTGKISDEWHNSLCRPPDFEDEEREVFEEIKD